jgi:hypothetical protein
VRANDCTLNRARKYAAECHPYEDPIPTLKRDAVSHIVEVLRHGNGDDLGYPLGTDRFRIADLRRGDYSGSRSRCCSGFSCALV